MPPIEYFALMAQEMVMSEDKTISSSLVWIEAKENFQKQTWRNRCTIYASEGPLNLSYPILHEGGTHKIPITEIKIDYSEDWILNHKRAIVSAYRNSAYFEYYSDEFFAILDKKYEKLFDLNLQLIKFFIKKLMLSVDLKLTTEYSKDGQQYGKDYRDIIHPKKKNNILKDLGIEKPYFQVFAQKHGYISNLSIMDLLFNEGPDSILYLLRSLKPSYQANLQASKI